MRRIDKLLGIAAVFAAMILGTGVYVRYLDGGSPHCVWGTPVYKLGAQRFDEYGCPSCHGVDGRSPLSTAYPAVSGQSSQYIASQIKEIRDGKRNNGLSGIMAQQIGTLSDENAEAIALYLSSLPR